LHLQNLSFVVFDFQIELIHKFEQSKVLLLGFDELINEQISVVDSDCCHYLVQSFFEGADLLLVQIL
tara:strand:+ start:204 stop:404 length:201 start_codon:yes stop_codon:yes gene_type:complete